MRAPDLESRLALLFSTMEARKAAIRREREDAKLSRRRYWRQEQPNNKQTHDEKA